MSENIIKQVEDMAQADAEAPIGYLKINMSTRGLYGAPASFHVRNFSVDEALELGMVATTPEDLPLKVTNLIQGVIYEKDVNVSNFFDQEVAELMIKFYKAFYQSSLKDQKYEPTDSDKEWVKKTLYKGVDGPDYQNWLRGVKTGKIPLSYDLDLNSVRYYPVGDKAHKFIKATKRGFEMMFQYPRFGDAAILQKAVKEAFRAEDRQFGPLYDAYKRKEEMDAALRRGEDVNPAAIPYIDPEDLKAVKNFEMRKQAFIITQMKGMYLYSWGGEIVADKPLSERIAISNDPRYDYSLYQTITETLNKLEIGPIPKVQIQNPVTGAIQEIDHPFRTLELLAAIKDYRSDDTIIESV